ncbi:MAG: hypothetical protein R3B09_14945 [Nannocystaceae bacterium]
MRSPGHVGDQPKARCEAILAGFNGHPDLPNGRPCGVLAYMVANTRRPRRFALDADGRSRRLGAREEPGAGERLHVVEVPRLHPGAPEPPRLHYAVIETDPSGVTVATLAKGTQDAIATRGDERRVIELGQPRQLLALLDDLERPDLLEGLTDRSRPRWTDLELTRLHRRAVEALLDAGYAVEIEDTFTAAVREAREEHGFDLARERAKVLRVDAFVEVAASKRRPSAPIEHHVYAAWVADFEESLPRVSVIVEEKDQARLGARYRERGVFLTLPAMWRRLAEAQAEAARAPSRRPAVVAELAATRSRLHMLERIERALVADLRRRGVEVRSEAGPGDLSTTRGDRLAEAYAAGG